jgi:hypothetical protein
MNRIFGIILIILSILGIFWLQERIDSGQLPNKNAVAKAEKGQIMMGLGICTGLFLIFKKIDAKDKDQYRGLEDY